MVYADILIRAGKCSEAYSLLEEVAKNTNPSSLEKDYGSLKDSVIARQTIIDSMSDNSLSESKMAELQGQLDVLNSKLENLDKLHAQGSVARARQIEILLSAREKSERDAKPSDDADSESGNRYGVLSNKAIEKLQELNVFFEGMQSVLGFKAELISVRFNIAKIHADIAKKASSYPSMVSNFDYNSAILNYIKIKILPELIEILKDSSTSPEIRQACMAQIQDIIKIYYGLDSSFRSSFGRKIGEEQPDTKIISNLLDEIFNKLLESGLEVEAAALIIREGQSIKQDELDHYSPDVLDARRSWLSSAIEKVRSRAGALASSGKAEDYEKAAKMYLLLGDKERAKMYYEKAAELYTDLNQKQKAYISLAAIYEDDKYITDSDGAKVPRLMSLDLRRKLSEPVISNLKKALALTGSGRIFDKLSMINKLILIYDSNGDYDNEIAMIKQAQSEIQNSNVLDSKQKSDRLGIQRLNEIFVTAKKGDVTSANALAQNYFGTNPKALDEIKKIIPEVAGGTISGSPTSILGDIGSIAPLSGYIPASELDLKKIDYSCLNMEIPKLTSIDDLSLEIKKTYDSIIKLLDIPSNDIVLVGLEPEFQKARRELLDTISPAIKIAYSDNDGVNSKVYKDYVISSGFNDKLLNYYKYLVARFLRQKDLIRNGPSAGDTSVGSYLGRANTLVSSSFSGNVFHPSILYNSLGIFSEGKRDMRSRSNDFSDPLSFVAKDEIGDSAAAGSYGDSEFDRAIKIENLHYDLIAGDVPANKRLEFDCLVRIIRALSENMKDSFRVFLALMSNYKTTQSLIKNGHMSSNDQKKLNEDYSRFKTANN
ncbi:MAG: hypothetical protein WCP89_03085, partial [archaeon]